MCQSVAVKPERVADPPRHEPRFGSALSARATILVALVAALLAGGVTVCPGPAASTLAVPRATRAVLGASTAALTRPHRGPGPPTTPGHTKRPLLAVIGASFAAGVGAGGHRESWAYQLARQRGWRIVISADPGAGFVNTGARHLGPLSRLAGGLDLVRLAPMMVIVQGGHNDVGRSEALVATRVRELVAELRRAVPRARLAIISVFPTRRGPSRAARATDRAIVQAARAADPSVLVVDPLTERWVFPRLADGLHPSAAGHAWIAARLAQDLTGAARGGQVVAVVADRGGQPPATGVVRR